MDVAPWERRIVRTLVHSKVSFSLNAWISSGKERSRAAPEDMMVGAAEGCDRSRDPLKFPAAALVPSGRD